MKQKRFLEHYRVCEENGSSIELPSADGLMAFKAVDTRFGETVTVKKLSVEDVDLVARKHFEEQARVARVLDHVNIAKLLGFGIEDGNFVFVTEYLEGETLDAWVAEHGPMPVDAVLRVGLQVVKALAAASIQGVAHGAVQPSNLVIVPGEVAEGGWPFVKLTNFGLASSDVSTGAKATDFAAPEVAWPRQSEDEASSFPSEVYSLGATMCFLLSGAIHPAQSRLRQLKRFPKPIRNLLAHMLSENREERPQDPVVFAEAIRECLGNMARRSHFAQKFGTPLVPLLQKFRVRSPIWMPRRALAIAALVLMLTVLAGLLWPQNVGTFLHRGAARKPIGVPIGVPEASAVAVSQEKPPAQADPVVSAPVINPQKIAPSVAQQAEPSPVNHPDESTPQSIEVATNDRTVEPPSPAAGPEEPRVAMAEPDSKQMANTQNKRDEDVATARVEEPSAARKETHSSSSEAVTAKVSTSTKTAAIAKRRSTAKRARVAQLPSFSSEPEMPPSEPGTFRARVVGATPDGNVILTLPSGETAIAEPPRHRPRRLMIERRQRFRPPIEPFDPGVPPND